MNISNQGLLQFHSTSEIMKSLFLLALLPFAALGMPESRIVGGVQVTDPNEFQFAVFLQFPSWRCTGSIIHANWVLTAGHCVDGVGDTQAQIILDSHNYADDSGDIIRSIRVIRHEDYRPALISNDVGVIQVAEDMASSAYPNASPVPYLSGKANHDDETVTAAGWGLVCDGPVGCGQPDDLRKVTVQTMPVADCRAVYGGLTVGFDICLDSTGGKGVCSGDSGGPTMSQDLQIQVGINSFVSSAGCESGDPHGLASVGVHRQWIIDNTGIDFPLPPNEK